jgi:hypothetical protein
MDHGSSLRRAARSLALAAVAALCCAPIAGGAQRDDLFDPGVTGETVCGGMEPGTPGPDLLTSSRGGLGLGGDDELAGDGNCMLAGDGNDVIRGTRAGGFFEAGPGDDRIDATGAGGVDYEWGNQLLGDDGNDVLLGSPFADWIDGGPGDDVIRAGAGRDRISGGQGHNTIDAGAGDDLVSANDGSRELVECGAGDDVVHADRRDRLVDCEHVKYRRSPYPKARPRSGRPRTRFTVDFVAPYPAGVLDPAGAAPGEYGFEPVAIPRAECDVTFDSARPYEPKSGQRSVWRVHTPARGCRGGYTYAVTFEWGDRPGPCNGSEPDVKLGRLESCPFRATVGYVHFEVR